MYISIIETKNNIFVSLSYKKNKKLVFQASGGMVNLPGRKRKTPLAGELLGKLLIDKLVYFKVDDIAILLHGSVTPVVKGIIRGLSTSRRRYMKFRFIEQVKGVAHNGVRLKKKRRL